MSDQIIVLFDLTWLDLTDWFFLLQDSTVFRLTDMETMKTIIQLRLTYCKSMKLTYSYSAGAVAGAATGNGNESNHRSPLNNNNINVSPPLPPTVLVDSRVIVVIDKDLTTTSRDWTS